MKTKLLGVVATLALFGVSQAAAYTIYPISASDSSGMSVNGTITTDGKIGVLGAADITAWSLIITGLGTTPFILTGPSGISGVFVDGSALTATSTNLLWNYNNSSSDFTLSENDRVVGDTAAFIEYFAGGGFGGFVIGEYTICEECGHLFGSDQRSGNDVIATATTPLPAALPLFATGLGALGLLGWRRKRKAAAAA